MGQPLRLYEPDRVYEITSRTIQGRLLLRPSRKANELIAGVIGRAQHIFDEVRVHGVVVLSNHITWLVSSPDPSRIPSFMGYVNGNISDELGRLHDWPGKMWERPHRPIPVLDGPSQVERFSHLLAQGCKEHLVALARQWPGVTCVPSLLGESSLRGTWFERDLLTRAHRSGKRPNPYDYSTEYTVEFAKLPCWAHLSDDAYAAQVAQLVEQIEDEAARDRAARGTRPLGVKALCRVHPHTRPDTIAKSPAPLCHASTSAARDEFRARYREFVAAFRRAAEKLKAGIASLVVFPPYCFPPRPPFVTSSA